MDGGHVESVLALHECGSLRQSFHRTLHWGFDINLVKILPLPNNGFFLACKDLGRMLDIHAPPVLFFFF